MECFDEFGACDSACLQLKKSENVCYCDIPQRTTSVSSIESTNTWSKAKGGNCMV